MSLTIPAAGLAATLACGFALVLVSPMPARTQPCLTPETRALIESRLNDLGTSMQLINLDLPSCLNSDAGELQADIQSFRILQAQALEPGGSTAFGGGYRSLVPMGGQEGSQPGSCDKYRQALAIATKIINNLER
jgi:hypothetical protein